MQELYRIVYFEEFLKYLFFLKFDCQKTQFLNLRP
jgi:hypothetical protein